MRTPGATAGKFWYTVYDGMWASLKAFFFHFEHIARSSLEWLNCRSVMLVVKFMMVLKGYGSKTSVSLEMWNRFTVPIFDPVARSWPFGLTASFIVEKPPVSDTLAIHFLILRSH